MAQTVGQFLLETAEIVRKSHRKGLLPVGKPFAKLLREEKGSPDTIREWVEDARNALELGLTPQEYASEIEERHGAT